MKRSRWWWSSVVLWQTREPNHKSTAEGHQRKTLQCVRDTEGSETQSGASVALSDANCGFTHVRRSAVISHFSHCASVKTHTKTNLLMARRILGARLCAAGGSGRKGAFYLRRAERHRVTSCLEPFMFHFTAHFTIPLLPSPATEYISLVVQAVVMFWRHSSKMQNNNNGCDKS